MNNTAFSRREFLKIAGASAAMLSLNSLGFLGGNAEASVKVLNEWQYGKWEDLHRKEWTWDKVTFGTHLVDCYPGNCLWRVYSKVWVRGSPPFTSMLTSRVVISTHSPSYW